MDFDRHMPVFATIPTSTGSEESRTMRVVEAPSSKDGEGRLGKHSERKATDQSQRALGRRSCAGLDRVDQLG
ncbi:hypothetical protein BLNAU_8049 [Blattamonas nauphoetae]|uniref:Uncharacterized protein n=1 Tax=Blattamonas nauphoetae TaxID=2049346 RepID=A0ABQ9XZT4_9EUKA|nr:hypothetical protein BLNAU_8049 [Blattamonas nauphoetae]